MLITLMVCITSCECDWCYERDQFGYVKSKRTDVIYFRNLSFYEEKLFGTWGCTDVWFGDEQVKEIAISEYGLVNIQLQGGTHTDRYNRTYRYVYNGKYITFYELGSDRGHQFKIYDYYVGSLYLQDWMGVHELRLYSNCDIY